MARSYSFAILQAMPDRTRGERVNVGVVIGTPNGVDIRAPELRKLQMLSGHEWHDIVDAYRDRLNKEWVGASDISSLRDRLGAISEIFTLSSMGTLLANANNYEERVSSILRAYVDRPSLTRREQKQKINAEIARYFNNAGILVRKGETIEDHKVVAKFVVSKEKEIRADFAYKNGRMKIVSTLDLRGTKSAHSKACEKGAALYFAKREFGPSTLPLGVYAVPPSGVAARQAEIEILTGFADGNVFNWLDIADRLRFSEAFY